MCTMYAKVYLLSCIHFIYKDYRNCCAGNGTHLYMCARIPIFTIDLYASNIRMDWPIYICIYMAVTLRYTNVSCRTCEWDECLVKYVIWKMVQMKRERWRIIFVHSYIYNYYFCIIIIIVKYLFTCSALISYYMLSTLLYNSIFMFSL